MIHLPVSSSWLLAVIVVIVAAAPSAPAQANSRYLDRIFGSVTVQTDVPFGTGRRENGPDLPLAMDIYTPADDLATDRPVIVLAFPGGFTSGNRSTEGMVRLATDFARRGYVAASIDYRLIEGSPDSRGDITIAIMQAIHDLKAAVRFFREDAAGANVYGVNGAQVFAGGISAGAVMAAVAGTLDAGDVIDSDRLREFLDANGGLDGNSSTNTQFSSAVSGVLQISGAVLDTSWVDARTVPIYAAHEEFDPIVPCDRSSGIAFAEFLVFVALQRSLRDHPRGHRRRCAHGFLLR